MRGWMWRQRWKDPGGTLFGEGAIDLHLWPGRRDGKR